MQEPPEQSPPDDGDAKPGQGGSAASGPIPLANDKDALREASRDTEGDAPQKEVVLYAVGNIENGFSNQFPMVLQQILIVTMMVNPVLIGLVIALKSVVDSVTDPIMAYISDNTRSRWGRRIPYILTGGVTRMLCLVLMVLLFPVGAWVLTNDYLETDKTVEEAREELAEAYGNIRGVAESDDPGQEGRERLDAASVAIAELRAELPATIAILERNLERRDQAIAEVDPTTEAGQAMLARRERMRNEVSSRLDTARSLLDEATKIEVLIEATRARLDGTLDAALRQRSERLMAELKIERLDRAVAGVEPVIGQWSERIAQIEEERQAGAGDPDDDEVLEYGRKRIAEAKAVITEARAMRTVLETAYEDIESGSPDVDSPGISSVNALVTRAGALAPPPTRGAPQGMFEKIGDGWKAFQDASNMDERTIILYLLVGIIVFTVLTTVQSVPYFALGIELCPSYDGRTKVAVFRSFIDKLIGVAGPWIPTICFMVFFHQAMQGLLWVTTFFAAAGIATTVLMCLNVRERTQISTRKKRTNFFKTVFNVMQNPTFWRVFFIYQVIGITWGIFLQFGFYLNIYWVMGSAGQGALLTSLVGSFAWALSLVALPVAHWASKKFEKHQVVMVAVGGMSVGTILQWWTVTPDYPYLQLVQPLFSSTGIVAFYAIMSSLLADVTDADELRFGERREGMFAAVQAFVGKMVGAATPVLAGLMLVLSGFQPEMEYNQSEQTILNMRLFYSIVPGCLLLVAALLLVKYPLNRARMAEIKAELRRRHEAEDARPAAESG